jgi:hypothetical protein
MRRRSDPGGSEDLLVLGVGRFELPCFAIEHGYAVDVFSPNNPSGRTAGTATPARTGTSLDTAADIGLRDRLCGSFSLAR